MSASREKRTRREAGESAKLARQEEARQEEKALKRGSLIFKLAALAVAVIFAAFLVNSTGVLQKNISAVTVGKGKYPSTVFNYYYWEQFNALSSQYGDYLSYVVDTSIPFKDQVYDESGATWQDYLTDQAVNAMTFDTVLNEQAEAAGFELSEESIAEIDGSLSMMDLYAQYYGLSNGEQYLKMNYGGHSSLKSYRNYMITRYTAIEYREAKLDSFEFSEDELEAYYGENKNDFDLVSYRSFFVLASADVEAGIDEAAALENAEAAARQMADASYGDEEAFISLAKENASETMKDSYDDPEFTLNKDRSYTEGEMSDWLFDDTRAEGDTTIIESSSGYYVLYFISKNNNNYNTASVRHILIKPELSSEDGLSSTDEDWAEAKAEAIAVFDEWKSSVADEDSFAELASARSADAGSAGVGGLYEGFAKGTMVSEFEDWAFDPSRAIGDSDIVETEFGYHIVYFVGLGGNYRLSLVDDAMKDRSYSDWYEEVSAGYNPSLNSFGLRLAKR